MGEIEEHTEPTPDPEPVNHGERIDRLEESVSGLTHTVSGLVTRLDEASPIEPDTAPASVPWTHRRMT